MISLNIKLEEILTMYWYSNSVWGFLYSKKENSYMSIKHSLFVLRFASWYLTSLSTTLQLYRGGQFYWWRKPPTYRKSLTHFITKCCIEYTSPLTWFELTTLVVIDTYYTGSCKSSYNTITTTTSLVFKLLGRYTLH